MSYDRHDMQIYLCERVQSFVEEHRELTNKVSSGEISHDEYLHESLNLASGLVEYYEESWNDDLEY